MRSLIFNGLQQLLDLIYPPKCVSCQRSGQGSLCKNCWSAIAPIHPPLCHKCGYPTQRSSPSCAKCSPHNLHYLDAIRSVASYDDTPPLRSAIHKFKYQNYQSIGRVLAGLLADCYRTHRLETDFIVPVPLHPIRFKERGYNQSGVLAAHLAAIINQPLDSKNLIRHRVTQTQMSLPADERKLNVADAFRCKTDALRGRRILLIDDVCTTGATLNACAEALKAADVAAVFGLTLARA
jgi:ComF family protein